MKRLKENEGITLIALIITIIVMLILVAVTVNVAINGGLFGEANKAATKTEKEAIYDQIVSAMVLEDKGFLNVSSTAKAAIQDLSKEYSVSPAVNEVEDNAEEVTLTVTGKKGTYEYTITEREILKDGEVKSREPDPTPGPGDGGGTSGIIIGSVDVFDAMINSNSYKDFISENSKFNISDKRNIVKGEIYELHDLDNEIKNITTISELEDLKKGAGAGKIEISDGTGVEYGGAQLLYIKDEKVLVYLIQGDIQNKPENITVFCGELTIGEKENDKYELKIGEDTAVLMYLGEDKSVAYTCFLSY